MREHHERQIARRASARQRGAAAILAMMFLVIFGSLATAMAIVSQGNLNTAHSHLQINRSLAAAETGMRYMIYRVNQITPAINSRDGVIDATNAPDLWEATALAILNEFDGDFHNLQPPSLSAAGVLSVGPIAVGPGQPTFTATFTPHPIAGENYNSSYYQRPPYNEMTPPVSAANPMDATWVRIRVRAEDNLANSGINRVIQMDFKIEKKIRFAILARSRVMIGRNVMIEGPIGSRFTDTHLLHGHPIQMVSDFAGLTADLDNDLDLLANTLALLDQNGDNRLNLNDPREIDGITDAQDLDINGDGYIDDYDYFLARFDSNGDGDVTGVEIDASGQVARAQLLALIDTFGDPSRPGYNDGVINHLDNYAKLRGEVKLTTDYESWRDGAAGGQVQDYFRGPIHPHHGEAPLTFNSHANDLHSFEPSDFDVSTFRNMTTNDFAAQVAANVAQHDPGDPDTPQPIVDGSGNPIKQFEAIPFGAAHPYDYYDRPVYENMTFQNVRIPAGTNALFKNCTFIGVTFVETQTSNFIPHPTDPTQNAYNYAGMVEADGTPKHPDLDAAFGSTKTTSNNLRFHGCTFEGSMVSDAPSSFTHVRNKVAFTGTTRFEIDGSTNLSDSEKALFKRSTLLTPHYSIEMGTFLAPHDSAETVELSGTIVAGILDARGNVKINGTILSTYEPTIGDGTVLGDTSPQFNTTLGYFPSSAGDMESELPPQGVGVIQVRYDPSLPLPDGILGPIDLTPLLSSYSEITAY